MDELIFSTLVKDAYTRSGLLHKIGLLKEYLEFVFFTKNNSYVEESLIEEWKGGGEHAIQDKMFLKSLPVEFWKSFSRESLYNVLDLLSEKVDEIPVLSLIVPVDLPEQSIMEIGKWVRSEIDKDLLLDVEVKISLSVGCQFVWKDRLHDFSLSRFLNKHQDKIHQLLNSRMKVSV